MLWGDTDRRWSRGMDDPTGVSSHPPPQYPMYRLYTSRIHQRREVGASMKRLIVSKPNGDVTQPFSIEEAQLIVRKQARNRGNKIDGWRLRVRGDEFGNIFHDLQNAMFRWEALVNNHKDKGDVIVLDIIDHPYSIVSRWVEVDPPAVQTVGNNDIDIIYGYWHDLYKGSRNAGICVYKFSGGRPSQHCRWIDNNEDPGDGANASDEFLDSMESMKDAAYEAVRKGKRFMATKGDDGIPL